MQDGQTQVVSLASLMPSHSDLDSVPPEYADALSSIQATFSNLLGDNPFSPEMTGNNQTKAVQTESDEFGDVARTMQAKMRNAFAEAMNPGAQDDEAIAEEDRVLSDPLVVQVDGLSTEQYEAWQEIADDDIPFSVMIGPDLSGKANRSDDAYYELYLPNSNADIPVHITEAGEILFVDYLRSSFQWAGFPELRNYAGRDEALLRSLKEGLIPF